MRKIEQIDINSWHLFIDESGTKGYKRLTKLKEKNSWEKFNPDTDPHSINFLSLIGLLISGKDLVNSFIPAIRKIKFELFQDEETVLHFSDMLTARGKFEMYKNQPELFKNHLTYFIDNIKDIDFRMFIVHINKVQMLNSYPPPAKPAEPYEFAPTVIMERVAGYFKSNFGEATSKPVVRVWFEERGVKDDVELKNYMVDELKLSEDELFNKTYFRRFSVSLKNIRSLEWHIHGLPKDPAELINNEYYKSKYLFEAGNSLIHGLHVADIMVSARRRFVEDWVYPKVKYLEVESITHFMSSSGKLQYEKFYPAKFFHRTIK
jgi:hypothetical protein